MAGSKPQPKAGHDVHPGVKMVQDRIAALKGKTGRIHDLGTNTVWYIAEQVREDGAGSAENDPDA